MRLPNLTCIKDVDTSQPNCVYCKKPAVKSGFTAYRKQRYFCKSCKKSFLLSYINAGYGTHVSKTIVCLLKEGCGIRSLSRLTGVCINTIVTRIKRIASTIRKPSIFFGQSYEMDELKTFIQRKDKPVWIAYAIRRETGEVVDFRVGNRSNKTLGSVIDTLLLSQPKIIHTDKLMNYRQLIPVFLHRTKAYGINHIERHNLSMRTHLKRLSRRRKCFSKSQSMLEACLKIHFWG